MSKNKKQREGIVYSTNPEHEYVFNINLGNDNVENSHQKLRIHLERLKGNKEATVIRGYIGDEAILESLGKILKSKCGVGGTVKDNEILLQGNHREKVLELLLKEGYSGTKKAGG
jgi:translation initiation factor 1